MPRYIARVLPGAAVAAALIASLAPALAADAPTPNKGDTAWMLTASVLVLLMTVPGLALFYAGLVRAKNVVSMLMQVLAIVCMVAIIWVAYGYSLAFTGSGALNSFVGGFSKIFLLGIGPDTTTGTFSNGVVIPELVFICFQMTFACITPALIVGGFAERMKFSALLLFVALWVTFVYFPMAHMVWYWAGPDALADAAKAVAAATDGAAKAAAQAKLDEVTADAGLIFSWGALDFAGGTVVHINSGIAALVGAIMLGGRMGYRAEPMAPHSVTLTMVGAALLWVGWFGFNAGSALESSGAGLALANTFVAAAAAGLAWAILELIFKWKFSLLGLASGVVAGLVAITPAAGFSGVMGAMVLGAVAGVVCLFFCTVIKSLLRYDDSLDVFGIHAIGGIVGAIGTGLVVNPEWGGAGLVDYVAKPGAISPAAYDLATQVAAQAKGVALTIVWCGVGSFIIFKIVDLVIGARVTPDTEQTGLDLAQHGERGYAYET